jgi:hypothetical protein
MHPTIVTTGSLSHNNRNCISVSVPLVACVENWASGMLAGFTSFPTAVSDDGMPKAFF